MIEHLSELYRFLDARTRRRLKFASVGLLFASLFEILGLVLLLPLMQMFAGSSTTTGSLGKISSFFGDPSSGALATILASIVFAAFLIKGVFNLLFRWWVIGFLNFQAAYTSDQLFVRYLRAPFAMHLRRNTAELIQVVNDAVSRTYLNAVIGILSVITEAATIFTILLVLFVLRPLPAFGIILYFAVVGYAFLRIVRNRAHRASIELVDSMAETYQTALQGLGGIKEVQVRQRTTYFRSEFMSARLHFATANRMAQFLAEAPRYLMEMLFMVGIALMSILVFTGSDTEHAAATLGLFVAAGFRILPSMVRLFASANMIRLGRESLRLVLEELRTLEGPTEDPEDLVPLEFSSSINVENVSFSYEDADRPVLSDIDLTIEFGRSLALVGSSGAGKTTLVDIILGLHQPSQGRVLVDGHDIATATSRWQRSIGLVPQDVFLLDDSLRANVAFGETDEEIDDERLTEAIERAQLSDLVASLPEGLATSIGERGVRLSGGQRQRIGIARALYLRPRLLVLDEATSSLDSETERQITATIESLHGRQTMLVVAHRLSTVQRCDELIFLRNGHIETRGTFDEVRRNNAEFAHLVSLGSLHPATEHLDPA